MSRSHKTCSSRWARIVVEEAVKWAGLITGPKGEGQAESWSNSKMTGPEAPRQRQQGADGRLRQAIQDGDHGQQDGGPALCVCRTHMVCTSQSSNKGNSLP